MAEIATSYPNETVTATGTKRIFLVEDDLDDQELIIDAITAIKDSIVVDTQTKGNKAILHLLDLDEAQLPNLIILDYNLPELNGSEILEALSLHNRFDAIPKVIWSTSSTGQFEAKCLALGATAYLIKPSDLDGINKLAQRMVDLCQ